MSKKTTAYKSLRTTERAHEMLVKIAEKEGLSIVDLIGAMATFFTENSISVTDEVDNNLSTSIQNLKKEMDDGFISIRKKITSTNSYLHDPILKNLLGILQNLVPLKPGDIPGKIQEEPVAFEPQNSIKDQDLLVPILEECGKGWMKIANDEGPIYRKNLQESQYLKLKKGIEKLLNS